MNRCSVCVCVCVLCVVCVKVSSVETELEGYLSRGLHHSNLVQYLSMHHHLSDSKITVEVS